MSQKKDELMRLRHLTLLALLAPTAHLACGPQSDEPLGRAAARVEVPNGVFQNTLSTNGLFENGVFQNGVFQNGVFQNGVFQNGVFQNGVFQNGVFQNGVFQNGVFQNGLWQDAIWQNNPAALEVLRTNAYAPQLLHYLYECAMTPQQSTVIDPGDESHANLTLRGRIGLAPQWGQPGGLCDESCQRWVTACLLARTNAYGVKVDISMRAPDNAPQHVKDALAVTDGERALYTLREGAFYGNIFQQAPQSDGTVVMDPSFHACAGPGSNIPQVTKRFCSSQGAGGPIEVAGACLPRPGFPQAACLGIDGEEDGTGAMHDCYTSIDPSSPGTHYPEVITVYLKRPIEVCGNSVCEDDEAAEKTCPSDCHPDGWARSYETLLSNSASAPADGGFGHTLYSLPWMNTSAVGPDNTVVLAGLTPSTVDLGGGPLTPGPGNALMGVIAKYAPGGEHLWSRRFGFAGATASSAVAADRHGRTAVALTGAGANQAAGWVGVFDAGGGLEWSRFLGTGVLRPRSLAFDDQGDLLVAGDYSGPVTFGATSFTTPSPADQRAFVLKLSPAGAQQWAVDLGQGRENAPTTLAADRHGDVLLGLYSTGSPFGLYKLSAASGATVWSRRGSHGGVTADDDGNVYATGALATPGQQTDAFAYDFALPPEAQGGDFFVVKYAAQDGAPQHSRIVSPPCHAPSPGCYYGGWFEGRDVGLDEAGDVVVTAFGGNQDAIDFGSGLFRTYETPDVFVVGFSPALEPRWAKHLPMVLDGSLLGVDLDGRGRVVLSGTFSGSMLVDDRLLVSHIPEQRAVGNAFLSAFTMPSASDVTPPAIDHRPELMTVQATGPLGAKVFFVPPTSTDAGHAGVTVACSPAPDTLFPIGTTPVNCVATDPLGNEASTSFTVRVIDNLGPAFAQIPAPPAVAPAGPDGAVVTFDPPLAVDLVGGPRDVTCSPASGSTFPLGTTVVTCSASDATGNSASHAFAVHVRYGGATCGNGQVDPGEQCDDGNAAEGDGCASSCAFNQAPDCSGAAASPAFILASSTQNFWPIAIAEVSDPDGDSVTITATGVRQDEPVSDLWCPGGTCNDATLAPLTVRAERDTWSEEDPQPDGRVYHITFVARDPHGAQCTGAVTVCAQRTHNVMSCGDGGPLYDSLVPDGPALSLP
jgi:cysteine-rich repeat protein